MSGLKATDLVEVTFGDLETLQNLQTAKESDSANIYETLRNTVGDNEELNQLLTQLSQKDASLSARIEATLANAKKLPTAPLCTHILCPRDKCLLHIASTSTSNNSGDLTIANSGQNNQIVITSDNNEQENNNVINNREGIASSTASSTDMANNSAITS